MLMTGVLSEHAFLSMVRLPQLKDCPITHDDIKIAHTLFGPDLVNIRGKTVRRSPKRVKTDYVKIPWPLLFFYQKCNACSRHDVCQLSTLPGLGVM
jgi:hypothetical protein